ncbi:flagellar hook-associated protein [Cryobacterium roopkundense]|uniref:Flagellar hook-associated protein 2 n=1 Tax=Cryobacterium roopkundense TaxID=1001240 RepID=A0A099JPD7_9MICO|nr:flagellar filament capping protein FliD [Cryobacterium roopkundense]KGJ79502.1 flagellar hook-associated protein [Cryobacterium roopkundense]MBB5640809.1 flagellar hook-associated protein 2 [Cryobacterium roopkundense]
MSMAIDGLVSGLDTTSLINSLMQLEAVPQSLLQRKVSESTTFISALQGLNSSIASLGTLATKTAKDGAFDLYSATSSSTAATVTAAAGASAGQIDIVVDELAQRQVSVSDARAAWPGSNFTITTGGSAVAINASSTDLDDIVSAVNASDAGVKAVKVSAGLDGNGAALYRVQFTANTTGAAGAFTVDQVDESSNSMMVETRTAQDAKVTLWAGTSAAQSISSSTNTFTDLLPGVSVTATKASADPVSITVARNDAAISTMASDLVSGLNGIFALISTKSAVVNSTNSAGVAVLSSGPFTGDSTIRDVNQRILTAASAPVNGYSPSEYGISITKTGTMEFDATKFAAALKADPVRTEAALKEIASRVADAATNASDKYDGQITSRITGQEFMVKDLGNQITDWDRRLASRRSTLERTYSGLEVQLSAMNSQSAWLTSQLSALTNSKSN